MEPKVINNYLYIKKPYNFLKYRVYCADSGSGNNWALGYNLNGPNHIENISKIIDKVYIIYLRL